VRPWVIARVCPQEYSEYVERIFPNDTAVAADANDAEFDGRILARPGEYPHMVRTKLRATVDGLTQTRRICFHRQP